MGRWERAVAGLLVAFALMGCVGPGSRAPSGGSAAKVPVSYMRVAHPDADTVSLQIALRRFVPTRGRGPEIWLVGASHVGESSYFAALQRRLDAAALVLFEGVGAKNKKVRFDPEEQDSVQHTLATSLGLVFQLEAIDYDRPHFRNSDLTIPQLRHLLEGGKNTAAGGDGGQALDELLQVMDGSSGLGALVNIGLRVIASSPKLREVAKMMMVETLGGFKGDLARMPGLPPSLQQLMEVIIRERDKVVLDDLRVELSSPHPPPSIAVFYGAGHMADLEQRLCSELAYRPRAEQWLTAMAANPRRAGLSPSELETARSLIRWQSEALQP